MKHKALESIAHKGNHECAPKGWQDVANCTGDYDLDATIEHRDNQSLPAKLKMHVRGGRSYGARTGYKAYQGYSGDN